MRSRNLPLWLAVAVVAALPSTALARIKLITLPVRERVEIQLDNPNATLVEEERIVPLVRGVNQVDFSWANTQIDAGTIVFRVLGGIDGGAKADAKAAGKESLGLDVKVLSVSYPPNEAVLVWQVSSSGSGSARVRISYLLGNMNKSFNYRAIAANDEKTLVLSEYIRIQNLANESFGSTGLWAGFGPRFLKPIGINETKEMLVEKFAAVPVKKTYTCDPQAHGYLDRPQNKLLVPMHYVLKNDKANHLGARRCNTARSASSRRTGTAARPSSARTGASSPRWTTKCGCMWAWPRTWWSSAPSTRTSSTASPATCSTARWSSSSRSRISRTRP